MTFPLNEMYGYSRLCDRLRSSAIIWKQVSLRSSAIIWKPKFCDLRSAIEMYPVIFLILTDDSTLLSHKARMFDYSNAHLP